MPFKNTFFSSSSLSLLDLRPEICQGVGRQAGRVGQARAGKNNIFEREIENFIVLKSLSFLGLECKKSKFKQRSVHIHKSVLLSWTALNATDLCGSRLIRTDEVISSFSLLSQSIVNIGYCKTACLLVACHVLCLSQSLGYKTAMNNFLATFRQFAVFFTSFEV